jgi:hypothetical protein
LSTDTLGAWDTVPPLGFYPEPPLWSKIIDPDSLEPLPYGDGLTITGHIIFWGTFNGQLLGNKITLRVYENDWMRIITTHTDENGFFSFGDLPMGCDLWLQINLQNWAAWFGNDHWAYFPEDRRIENLQGNTNLGEIEVSADQGFILYQLYYSRKFCGEKFGWQRQSVEVFHSYIGDFLSEFRPILDEIHISQAAVWDRNGQAVCHEYGHAQMHALYGAADYSSKFINYISNHGLRKVTNKPTAFCEGWAEFFGYAVVAWLFESYSFVEDFYPDNRPPYYTGDWPYTNTDGTVVEGAVMQVLWDLKDGTTDEGVGPWWNNVWSIIHDYEPNSIDGFLDGWEQENFPSIVEMADCNLFGVKPEAPDYLQTGYVTHSCVPLRWTDHAYNEGKYLIYRQRQYQDWELISRPPVLGIGNTGYYDDNDVDPAILYFYIVRALTCDSSNFSDLISVRVKYLPVTNLVARPAYESMKLNWNKPSSEDWTLIVRSENEITWQPIDGISYDINDEPEPGVIVVHNDDENHSQNPFVDEGLTNGITYYYKAFAYNEGRIYSRGEPVTGIAGGIVISKFNGMTAYNNTSRIASGGGKLHLVTVDTLDNGAADTMVVYTYSTDNGMTWSTQERVPPSGDPYGGTNFPALALNTQNIPYVLFGKYDRYNGAYQIFGYIRHRDENGWHYEEDRVLLSCAGSPSRPIAVPPLSLFMHGDTAYLAMVNNVSSGVLQCS